MRASDRLGNGARLKLDESIFSSNGLYELRQQADGNLVGYGPEGAFWANHKVGSSACEFVMQSDGNAVAYTSDGKPVWATGCNGKGKGPFQLIMQDDRNIVIYDSNNTPIWASHTVSATSADGEGGAPQGRCRVQIAAFDREPDVKVMMEMQAFGPHWARIKTEVPVLFSRGKKTRVFFEYPNLANASRTAVRQCVQAAVALTVLECTVESFLTSPAAAWALFKEKFASIFTLNAVVTLGTAVVREILADCSFAVVDSTGEWSRKC